MKKALITGITGQDGSILARLLLGLGYEVHGVIRRVAVQYQEHRCWRLQDILDKIIIHEGSVENFGSIYNIVKKVRPDECYHLAAQSFVSESFKDPFTTMDVNITGTLNILEAIRYEMPICKFYFAGSSEQFGKVKETPQSEKTPFNPISPYAISKVAGYELVRNYREAYGMQVWNGILFNHESRYRGSEFVTKKITIGVALIHLGISDELRLGNLDAKRDWGYAPDYCEAMWSMLQTDYPDDYVIATGRTHSIKDFCKAAFDCVDLNWEDYVVVDEKFFRPTDVMELTGDYRKASKSFGFEPVTGFHGIVESMVKFDMEVLR